MVHSITVSAGGNLDKHRSRGAQLWEHPVLRKERRDQEALPWVQQKLWEQRRTAMQVTLGIGIDQMGEGKGEGQG